MHETLATTTSWPPDAGAADAATAAYHWLSRAPAVALAATLGDLVAATERPKMPGADGKRPNWSIVLPVRLGALETAPVARLVAEELGAAVGSGPGTGGGPDNQVPITKRGN
jgi:4-alpha-glucanotransferase